MGWLTNLLVVADIGVNVAQYGKLKNIEEQQTLALLAQLDAAARVPRVRESLRDVERSA